MLPRARPALHAVLPLSPRWRGAKTIGPWINMNDWRTTKPGSRARRKVKHPNDVKKKAKSKDNPLAAVFRNTVISAGPPKYGATELLSLDEVLSAVLPVPDQPATYYEVANEDTIAMAERYLAEQLNPLVLNMASQFKPGGGVARGATAQEEELFRRTDACAVFNPDLYPLEPEHSLYAPAVRVLKDAAYQPVDKGAEFAMIAMPAIRKPKVRGADYRLDEDRELMRRKVHAIFRTAVLHSHDSLVLGALGCGAYGNPPEAVCALFAEAARLYGAHFSRIGFAVLVKKPSDEANLSIFRNCAWTVK